MYGPSASESLSQNFNEFKERRSAFLLLFPDKNLQEFQLLCAGGPEATYQDFVQNLPPTMVCYGIVRVEDCNILVLWAPDGARVKDKVVLSAYESSLRRLIPFIDCKHLATDPLDIESESIVERSVSYHESLGKARQ